MGTKRVNKRRRKEKDNPKPDGDGDVDTISTLPDDILCRILSLVPTKTAAKTSVLSKRWGRVWTFVPRFEAQSLYQSKTFFSRFMDNYFKARRETSHAIASFDLCTTYHGAKSRVDFWLGAAVSSRVEEFKLRFLSASVDRKKVHIYSFPRTFLLRMSSLRFLALEGIEWPRNGASPFDFPSLKALSLEKIYGLADEQLTALLSASPSLEDLLLKNCVDLRNPRIKSSNLKTVKVVPENCSCVTKTVQLEAENVESLVYDRGHSHETCGLVLVSCESMKSLSLSNASFSDSLLRGLVSALPFLEELVLDSCKELRDIRIESVSLVRLVVKNVGFCLEKKATIVAPKLAFFSFCDESLMSLSLNGPTFLAVDIKIFAWRTYHNNNYTREWYVNLINFLTNLDSCKGVSVSVSMEKALIIPTELRTVYFPPLPTLKHLKVTTEYPLYRKRIFRASLSWISPSAETLIVEEKAKFY